MKCPSCEDLFTDDLVGWSMDEEYDYIEITVTCDGCGKSFFQRIMPNDLKAEKLL